MCLETKAVYSWLVNAVHILAQLEKLGIFQADFRIRNTIKLGETFEAIDFDYAFQVFPSDSPLGQAAHMSTCELLKYWLESDFESEEFNHETEGSRS
jgi:hypothetical protein